MSDTALNLFAPDVADNYEDFLRKFKDSMDGIIEKMNILADNIDQKSEDNFTKGFKNYIDTIAAVVDQSTNVTKEVTDDCVRELSNKNAVLENQRQEEYLQQIRSAANSLDDVLPYKGCELVLGGTDNLSENNLEKMFEDFTSAGTEWEDVLKELSAEASSLADNQVQDEMTDVYKTISDQLKNIADVIEQTLQNVAARSMAIIDNSVIRKVRSENNAEEKAQETMQQFQHKMEDAMSLIDGLELD